MPFPQFPSFWNGLRTSRFKKTVYEKIDRGMERFTAGLNVQDIREILRGEPPSRRPNPRLRPHADSFWLHIRPNYFHQDVLGLYPTFRLGWLAVYFLVLESITGLFLMIWYTPSPDAAYGSMIQILSRVPLGQLMRDLHRLGAEAMVVVVALHMLRAFLTASYKKPRQFTWFTGVILLITTLFLSFSGYLLPWDQLSLWAVTIGTSMVEATPPEVVGNNLNLLLRGGAEIGANGLLRFYLLHILAVPAILLIFTCVHYYKVIKHGHSLPPGKENDGVDTARRIPLEKRVYFIPDILGRELLWVGVTTLILLIAVIWFYHAPLENHADPLSTPRGTTAPWYFLWIQGALKLGNKTTWGVLFPAMVFIILLILPYVDTGISRRFARRRVALAVCFMWIASLVTLTYMGTAEYGVASSADEEILYGLTHESLHGEVGAMLTVPFDQLVPGMYSTRQFAVPAGQEAEATRLLNEELVRRPLGIRLGRELRTVYNETINLNATNVHFSVLPTDAPELRRVMEDFYEQIRRESAALCNGWGMAIVTENQPDLVRVDVILVWQAVEMETRVNPTTGAMEETTTPRRDENGQVIPKFYINGVPVYLMNLKYTFVHRNSAYFP